MISMNRKSYSLRWVKFDSPNPAERTIDNQKIDDRVRITLEDLGYKITDYKHASTLNGREHCNCYKVEKTLAKIPKESRVWCCVINGATKTRVNRIFTGIETDSRSIVIATTKSWRKQRNPLERWPVELENAVYEWSAGLSGLGNKTYFIKNRYISPQGQHAIYWRLINKRLIHRKILLRISADWKLDEPELAISFIGRMCNLIRKYKGAMLSAHQWSQLELMWWIYCQTVESCTK